MTQPLSENSWQYRQLNYQTPGLRCFSDALLEAGGSGRAGRRRDRRSAIFQWALEFARIVRSASCSSGSPSRTWSRRRPAWRRCGMKPYVATFASFLALLCCEQIRMDVAYSALPVRLIGHHAGISLGFYGTSHHATEDLAITRSIAESDGCRACRRHAARAPLIEASADHPEPIYFRIQRGRDPVVYDAARPFVFGKAIVHLDRRGTHHRRLRARPSIRRLQAARALNAERHGRSA